MAKKAININGSATQMVDDINSNFNELYDNQGESSAMEKDHTAVYTTDDITHSSGKVMADSDGKLVFQDIQTSRKIFCLQVEQDDSVVYTIKDAQAASGDLAYALVDSDNNIIAKGVGSTSNADIAVLVSLVGVSKIYISKGSSATSASVDVVVFGDDDVVAAEDVVADFSHKLTYFKNKDISITASNELAFATNTNNHIIVCMACNCKRIEGYSYRSGSGTIWAVLDKNLKVLKSYNNNVYLRPRTPFQSIPDGARFIVFTDTAGLATYGSESFYKLTTAVPKVEYNVLVLGNSYTYNYWNYVPAILQHWLGDEYKVNIFVGMKAMSTTAEWASWLNEPSNSKGFSISYNNEWVSYGSTSAQTLFSLHKFDLVGFQQYSGNAATYSTWSDLWQGIVDKVCSMNKKRVGFMWTMVHAKPNGNSIEYTDNLMEQIFVANQSMQNDFPVDVCPVGTAIQNARHTAINELTWVGNDEAGQLTLDGSHLQGGIAPFLAGLVVARFICEKLGVNTPCTGDEMSVDSEFDSDYTTLDSYTGESKVYSTGEAMDRLVQRCVEAALQFPYEIKTNLELIQENNETGQN